MLNSTTPGKLNKAAMSKYHDLPIPCESILITYIWIDRNGISLRSKDRTLDFVPNKPKDVPICCFDAVTTEHSPTDTDIWLYPQVLYHDPFRRMPNVLALCETYRSNYRKTVSNQRKSCIETCESKNTSDTWFGFSQEFVLKDTNDRALNWPIQCVPPQPGPYYCSLGADKIVGRDLMEAFYRCCLYAGIKMFGINPGEVPCKWSFQIGPCPGIRAADDLWMSRYILSRLAEEYGALITIAPEPIHNWPTKTSLLVYFSTKDMREEGGMVSIERIIEIMSQHHAEHIEAYYGGIDSDNNQCCSGEIKPFSAGVGDRNATIRIPQLVFEDKRGYLEDRRPPSNADPYRIITRIALTCCRRDSSSCSTSGDGEMDE